MIIGRKEEINTLKEAYESDESKFIAVYGRRRVGKTFLVRETFDYTFTFSHSGIANQNTRKEIDAFCDSLKDYGVQIDEPVNDWLTVFSYLKKVIISSNEKKKVIFLDELSWIATNRSADFLNALELFWNSWASARKDVLLIVSASATSWLLDHIIHSKGGFYHRLSHAIHLFPFSLKECKEYSNKKDLLFTDNQLLEYYMVFGGVPYYWSLLKRGCSVSENVDRLCFHENGELHNEFSYLYASLFTKPEDYIKIISTIAKKRKGLTRVKIFEEAKIEDNGSLSKKLNELIECGFLRKYLPYGKKKNGSLFQLIDNFSLFYFHMMNPMPTDENYYQNNLQSGRYNSFVGLSFELVCLEHIRQIKFALGIIGVATKECSWVCKEDDENGIKGHQIDLLIERADGIINMCEMKYSSLPYSISKTDEENYQCRIRDFSIVKNNKKPIIFTMISPYGIVKNSHSNVVVKTLTLDDLMSI